MSSPDGKGYLIPEDASPTEMDCILVFYPADSQNYYLRALLGSLTYLGTWTAWERDPEKRGRLAAAAWKNANDCTFDTMSCITDLVTVLGEIRDAILSQQISLDAGELVTAVGAVATAIDNQQINFDPSGLLPALTGIEEAIEGIECSGGGLNEEDMSIVINNCQCCGCGGNGGGGTSPDDNLPPDLPPDDLPMPPPIPYDPYDPDQWAVTEGVCAIAHYVLIQWRNFCIAIGNGEVTRLNLVQRFDAVLPGALSPVSGITWMITASQAALYLALYFVGFVGRGGDVAREVDSKLEILKCIMLSDSAFEDKAVQGKVIIESMSLPATLRGVMKILWQYLPFSGVRQFASADQIYLTLLPEWAFTPGCPACVGGGDDEQPQLGTVNGYKWVPVTNSIQAFTINGGTFSHDNGKWSVSLSGERTLNFPGDFGLTSGNYKAYAFALVPTIGSFVWYRLVSTGYMNLPIGVNQSFGLGSGIIANLDGLAIVSDYQIEAVARGNKIAVALPVGIWEFAAYALVSDSYTSDEFPHPNPI